MLDMIDTTEQAAYDYATKTIHDTVDRLLGLSRERGVTPREAAVQIATENIEANARKYGREEAVAAEAVPS